MAGQRINIMELRSLIALKLKGLSNRKVAKLLQINRKTVDVYTSRFIACKLSYEELSALEDIELKDLFVENSQTEKERYEGLSSLFATMKKELRKPGCTLQELWKTYSKENPTGYKYTTILCFGFNSDKTLSLPQDGNTTRRPAPRSEYSHVKHPKKRLINNLINSIT